MTVCFGKEEIFSSTIMQSRRKVSGGKIYLELLENVSAGFLYVSLECCYAAYNLSLITADNDKSRSLHYAVLPRKIGIFLSIDHFISQTCFVKRSFGYLAVRTCLCCEEKKTSLRGRRNTALSILCMHVRAVEMTCFKHILFPLLELWIGR